MSGAGGDLILQQLPPGFRFHPTDHELVVHYLCRKCAGLPISVPLVAEIDLYKYDPWKLPGMALYGEKEWYFFSPRDRKYPNGSRPNRAAGSGYWKATGADKPVGSPKAMGIKKALVFYTGKAPKGEKTNWIMHEYRLADVDRSARKKNSLRLDDWVLCRIYNKKGSSGSSDRLSNPDKKPAVAKSAATSPWSPEERKPVIGAPNVLAPGLAPAAYAPPELVCFAPSDSMPRLHADSSCSEHVLSPEFACGEVQSEPRWRPEWDRAFEAAPPGSDAAAGGSAFGQFEPFSTGFRDPLQDILMYWGKPF